MEHREDLEELLLNGLPHGEREHVVRVMGEQTAAKLQSKRAAWVSDDDAGRQ